VLRAFEVDFTALRLELREAVFRAEGRAEDFADDFLAEVFGADVFLAAVLAVVFFAVVFFAVVFLAEDLADERAEVAFDADFALVFLAVVFLAGVFLALDLAEDFAAERDVDLAAVFLAAAVFVPEAFFVPEDDFFAPEVLVLLVELRRALLFFAVFLVLVAPVSPVNSIVSGFLVSVGIAASFKGLRVQPSRLQGNVVIPRGFRISESVDSRTATFSVDISTSKSLCTCERKTQDRVQDETVRVRC